MVSKAEHLSNTPPDCQLIVKGIRPSTEVDLYTGCSKCLALVGTITSRSSNINIAPIAVSYGMFSMLTVIV